MTPPPPSHHILRNIWTAPFFQADKVPEKVLNQDKQNKGRAHKDMPKIDTIDTLCDAITVLQS